MLAPTSAQDKQLVQTGSTMALAAYGSKPPGMGWVPLPDPLLATANNPSGFQARTYVNTTTKQIWVAVAGTNDGKEIKGARLEYS